MRMIVTGLKDGKSCVVRDVDYPPQGSEFGITPGVRCDGRRTAAAPCREQRLRRPAGPARQARLARVSFQPGDEFPFHCTDTIDCHTIVAGSMELLLDDGPHRLEAGDCAMVKGVDHGWRVGPEGCTSSLMLIGTPSPDA